MCVAIAQKQGANPLSSTQLSTGWRSNPDGGGYAYIHPETNEIIVRKYLDEGEFTEAYLKEQAEFGDRSPFIVHMRIQTHGGVSIETTHPFRIDRDEGMMVMAHNGIISNVDSLTGPGVSDTMAMAGYLLTDLPVGWLDNQAITWLVEEFIGASKLVFLTTEKAAAETMYIINEDLGSWNDSGDTWFSNHSCEVRALSGYFYSSGAYPKRTGWWTGNEDRDDLGLFVSSADGKNEADDDGISASLLPRFSINPQILSAGYARISVDAVSQGYCGDCLYHPCDCENTCYYCNRSYGTCQCDYWITIAEMKDWCGDDGFQEMREEDIRIFESNKEGTKTA